MTASTVRAWCVHLYTALGAVVALYTILAIESNDFRQAFGLMVFAVVIDATDGTLARAAGVQDLIPWFDGDRLEYIIDFLNYAIVPCLFLLGAELLPPMDAPWLIALPLVASAYGFGQKSAKTADYFFLGFPSYWNIIAFYLYLLKTPLWINAFLIIILSILVFVPIRFIYPSRSPRFRGQTNFLGALWGLALLVIIYRLPEPPGFLIIASLAYPAYYLCLSLWLELRRVVA
ncbi:MAG: CDP-diacylglycerol O-phosphatidyltransferase [Deltaproteobacteria bacterium]|nr:CDP-diacylglycerol O-phosphatidyltransferase [Deltaproteobacteria bacterium]